MEIYTESVKYIIRCSASLVIRKMQIKSTVRCQYTPTRMAKLVKTDTTLLW